MDKLITIVPAAGAGKRLGLGKNKAFALLKGIPLIVHCLKMLASTELVDRCIVVFAPGEIEEGQKLLAAYQKTYFPDLPFTVVAGGKERQDSVTNALLALETFEGYIAVHDGARPFAGKDVFARTWAAARKYGAAIAAVPVKNTIKIINTEGIVISTPDRNALQAVQTPQIFRADLLKKAYAYLSEHPTVVTDDASVVELYGSQVAVAMGRYENIKITTPEDLTFAEYLLELEEQGNGK